MFLCNCLISRKKLAAIFIAVSLFTQPIPTLGSQTGEEEIQFTHLTAEDGLSLSAVTQILQDSRGFLWFGTYNGLNRYDGYNFKIFLPEQTNPKSISNHSITSICEDSKGFIWIGTLDGLNRYDWKTEEFHKYKNNPEDLSSISGNNIISITEDSSGTVWIGTLNGLNKYNREQDNFTVIKKVNYRYNPDSLNSVVCLEEDYKGNLWMGTWNGLSCMQKDGKIIKQLFADSANAKDFNYRKIATLFEDNLKNLWIGTYGNGLIKYNQKTETFTKYISIADNPKTISNGYITVMYQDKLNNLWIGTKDGLNKYEPQRDDFIRILHNSEKPLSILNNEILAIKEDNNGMIWVGNGGGVSWFYQPINKFKYYKEEKFHSEKSLISNRINSVFIDSKENVWVGTFGGLDEIKSETNQIIHYRHLPGNSNSLSNDFVMSVFEDREGIIWIGTNHSGLNRYNPITGEWRVYKYDITDLNSISNDGNTTICEDHNGNLWIGTWWGLNRFDRKKGKFYRYHYDPSNPNTIRNDLIWIVYEDSQGMLWIGTDGGGLSKFNPKTNTFIHFTRDSSSTHHISENRVFALFESSDGIMWFGTSDGLNSYDRKTDKIIIYNTTSGLSGNLINSIQEDNKGFLWISTDKGLSKFNRKTGTFKNYTKRNGLKELEFNLKVSAKSKKGILYFGNKAGLMFFDPDSIKDEMVDAPVVITDLKIYNQHVAINAEGNKSHFSSQNIEGKQDFFLNESIIGAKSISIPYEFDVITFEFALLDFFDVKKNRFSYKLVGFDANWNDVGNRNTATYTNLPPGDYTFCVKAFNSNGIKDVKETSIKIKILPAYYQTWWFRIFAGVTLFFVTVLVINGRTRKIKNHNKLLEKYVSERTKDLDKTIAELSQEIDERKKVEAKVQASLEEKEVLLKEIHHRVKNNLQVISSLLYLNSKKITDENALYMFKESQNRVKSIALVHERLYQSQDLGRIDFKDYIQRLMTDLFRSYAVNQSVIKLAININDVFISIDTAVPCGLIINELVSNSFKYAFPDYEEKNKEGLMTINFNRNGNNELILEVRDNGIGMPSDFDVKKQQSLGLQLVDTLVSQLEGTMENDLSSGTAFKIKFND